MKKFMQSYFYLNPEVLINYLIKVINSIKVERVFNNKVLILLLYFK
jgi:hypothetical protein